MIVRYTISLKIYILFLAFFIPSCALLKAEKTFSKNGLKVTFRSLNSLDDVQSIKFRYPIILSEQKVLNHLLSLWHNEIVSPGKPKPVFSFDEGNTLAPLISKALKKVDPGKYLNFEFKSSKGLIEGQVFATAKKIHWRFIKINNRFFSNDPLRIRKPTWKLVRTHGQTYQKLQSNGFEKVIKNSIIVDINLPFPKRRSQKIPKPNASNNNLIQSKNQKLELKNKLDTLKKFFDVGLINKSEYENKKENLINQYLIKND
jgi:hypothetical protein